MTEKFLHHVWQHKLYNATNLQSTKNDKIEVINPGQLNNDAGPDFFNAKIKINNTVWAGNIEIHINSSDWFKHKHHQNKVYDSIILHIVLNSDADIYRRNNELIPQIILTLPPTLEQKYKTLQESIQWVGCAKKLQHIDPIIIKSWLHSLLIERLTRKCDDIEKQIDKNYNWEEAFYQTLAKNFGFGVNSDPFELLSKSLPLKYLGKHKDKLFQIEALLFGQAGLLHIEKTVVDEYQTSLLKEYTFLKQKFKLTPIDGTMWKMLRLRPNNFPYIRIAQFAALICQSSKLFSKIIEDLPIKDLQILFKCKPSEYWDTHYRFGSISPQKTKIIGDDAINTLLINTIIPFLFCYGKNKNNEDIQNKAITLLEVLPAEKNTIVKNWGEIGIRSNSAYHTQALLELKNNYCEEKKCLRCRIGHKILTINQ